MKLVRCTVSVLAAVVVPALAGAQGHGAVAGKAPSAKTVRVDCTRPNADLNEALADKADVLVVEFGGECYGTVVVPRGDVTLRGISADAGIVGPGATTTPVENGLTVTGASNVALESFAVRGWSGHGILLSGGASATLSGVSATQNGIGMFVDEGTLVTIGESSFDSNVRRGLCVFGASDVRFAGSVTADDTYVGMLVSGSSTFSCPTPCEVEVNGNWAGLWMQNQSSGLVIGATPAATLRANDNQNAIVLLDASLGLSHLEMRDNWAGVQLSLASTFELFRFAGDLSGNAFATLYASEASHARLFSFDEPPVISGGTFGILADMSSWVLVDDVELGGSLVGGLVVDGAAATVSNVTAASPGAVLSFGARVDFAGGNSFAGVSCDGTVLVRGDVACGAAAAVAQARPPRPARMPRTIPEPPRLRVQQP